MSLVMINLRSVSAECYARMFHPAIDTAVLGQVTHAGSLTWLAGDSTLPWGLVQGTWAEQRMCIHHSLSGVDGVSVRA